MRHTEIRTGDGPKGFFARIQILKYPDIQMSRCPDIQAPDIQISSIRYQISGIRYQKKYVEIRATFQHYLNINMEIHKYKEIAKLQAM